MAIEEVGNDNLVLNPNLLRVGDAGDKYCLITKAVNKVDANNNLYIQLFVKGRNGKQIVGRLFGDYVDNYKNILNTLINKVAVIGYTVSEVYGTLSLDVTYIAVPDKKIVDSFKSDLFNSTLSNITYYVDGLTKLAKENKCSFTQSLVNLMNQPMFTALVHKSDPFICDGYDGSVYVVMYTVWERLLTYKTLGILNESTVGIIMCAHTIAECIINKYDENSFDYNLKVFNQVYSVCSTIKFGSETERTILKDIMVTYINLRFDIKTNTESKYGKLLYNEFNNIYTNLAYFTKLNSMGNSIAMLDGKFVR